MSIVQALVTALLSGLFSGGVLFALNERRDRMNLLRDKTECAIEAYSDWMETLSTWPIAHFQMFIGDRATGRDATASILSEARRKYLRAEVLIRLYLPHKQFVLANGAQSYQPFIAIGGQMGVASLNGEGMKDEWKKAITDVGKAVVEARASGFSELVEEGRSTVLPPYLVRLPSRTNANK